MATRCKRLGWAMLAVTACWGCSNLDARTALQGRVCLDTCGPDGALADVLVELRLASDASAGRRPTQRTDANGRFIFPNVSSTARYLLAVQDNRYICGAVAPTSSQTTHELICRLSDGGLSPGANACGQALPGIVVPGADLSAVDVTGADLTDADFSDADLSGATLTGADLSRARLNRARLVETVWSGRARGCEVREDGEPARLIEAVLADADLSDSDLRGVLASNASLVGAELIGSDLSGAALDGANLARLRAWDLRGCPSALPVGWSCLEYRPGRSVLVGPEADLDGIDASNAELSNAPLNGVSMRGADLRGALLVGAALDGADLADARLEGARAYRLTGCPARRPAQWQCLPNPATGRFLLVGPGADLSGAQLDGVDLSEASLAGLKTGGGVRGCPALPQGWACAALSEEPLGYGLGGDLVEHLARCPAELPQPRRCLDVLANTGLDVEPSGAVNVLIGPDADLSGSVLVGLNVEEAFDREPINADALSNVDLSDSVLFGANLRGLDLSGARLERLRWPMHMHDCPAQLPADVACAYHNDGGAALVGPGFDLTRAQLASARLEGLDLSDTRLSWADLSFARLSGARMDRTVLLRADLSGAYLNGVDLSTATLTGARGVALRACPSELPEGWSCAEYTRAGQDRGLLVGPTASLHEGDLSETTFSGLALEGADLSGAQMTRAVWSDVVLRDAQLTDTVLINATFDRADLSGADLSGADLTGADLSGADLTEAAALELVGCPDRLPEGWACVEQRICPAVRPQDLHPGGVCPSPIVVQHALVGPDARLDGFEPRGISACPDATLPTGWSCIDRGDHAQMIGPGADLRGADLAGLDLSGADLRGVRTRDLHSCPERAPEGWICLEGLQGALLVGPGVDLSGARLRLFDLSAVTQAHLEGVRADELEGCDGLDVPGWRCVQAWDGALLIGPGADLSGVRLYAADLRGADLTGVDLSGVVVNPTQEHDVDFGDVYIQPHAAYDLVACPAAPPSVSLGDPNTCAVSAPPVPWRCVEETPGSGRYALIGPMASAPPRLSADLRGADLGALGWGVDFTGTDLTGSDLTGAQTTCTRWSDAVCPDGTPASVDGSCDDHLSP